MIWQPDVRFWKMMADRGKETDYKTTWNLLKNDKIKTSNYRFCEINEHWRVNHPLNVVRVGGLSSIRMTAKFNKGVIFGHGHWQGFEFAPNGKDMLIAPGCLCDPIKIAYRSHFDTSHNEWIPGFCLIRDKERATLFNEKSDWDLIGMEP